MCSWTIQPLLTATALALGTRPLKYQKGDDDGSIHCGMLGVLLIARPSVASRAFCCLDTRTTILILVFTASKMKQSVKTPLVWAFIFQNANPEVC